MQDWKFENMGYFYPKFLDFEINTLSLQRKQAIDYL